MNYSKVISYSGLVVTLIFLVIPLTFTQGNARLNRRISSLKRRTVQEDFDESNLIVTNEDGFALMPRTDNRNNIMESDWPRPRPRCNRKIRIQNGVTRFRDKGSLVRYECSFGFTLFGAKLAVCLRDQWSEPPPICVKLGCRRLTRPPYGTARLTFGGAVVAFFCNGGYRMVGKPVLYCDGNRWNGTEPSCEFIPPPTTPTPPTTQLPTSEESELSPFSVTMNFSEAGNVENWDYNSFTTLFSMEHQEVTTKSESYKHGTETNQIHDLLTTTALTRFHTTQQTVPHSYPDNTESSSQETTPNSIISSSHAVSPELTTPSMTRSKTTRTVTITEKISPIINTTPKHISTASETMPLSTSTTSTTKTKITSTAEPTLTVPTTTTVHPTTKAYFPVKAQTTKVISDEPFVAQTTKSLIDDNFPFPNNVFDKQKFDDEIPKPYESGFPEFIQPIAPHKLDTNDAHDHEYYHKVAQLSIVGGIVLIVIGSLSLVGGMVMYCWRKNKGIARARSWDTDGRTLSASDANDDFMWMESRDSRL